MPNNVPLTVRDHFFLDPFFRDTWTMFDDLHREMAAESAGFWQAVENDMRAIDRHHPVQQEEKKDDKKKKEENGGQQVAAYDPWFFPRRWMMPRLFSENLDERMRSLDLYQHPDEQMIRMKDDESRFEVSLATHGYKPDELKVSVEGNVLAIEGKHETKTDGRAVSRRFSRHFTLPEGCEADKVHSNLSSDGVLVISAPKNPALTGGPRAVPIEMQK